MQEDKLKVQAYVSRSLTLGDKSLATEFVELPCDVLYGDVERVGGMSMPAAGLQQHNTSRDFAHRCHWEDCQVEHAVCIGRRCRLPL